MSGPLASWCLAHTTAPTAAARLVLACLALKAHHDGSKADLIVEDLAAQSGLDASNVRRALAWLQGHKELEVVEHGGGRGRETRRRIVIRWCPADVECFTCGVLVEMQPKVIHRPEQRKSEKPSRQRASSTSAAAKPSRQRDPSSNRVAYPQENPRVSTAKPSRQRDPLRNGNGSILQVEPLPHPESAAALAPDGAAAERGETTTKPSPRDNGKVPGESHAAIARLRVDTTAKRIAQQQAERQQLERLNGPPAAEPEPEGRGPPARLAL